MKRPENPLLLLEGGLTIREAAEEHGIPRATLGRWVKEYKANHAKLKSGETGYAGGGSHTGVKADPDRIASGDMRQIDEGEAFRIADLRQAGIHIPKEPDRIEADPNNHAGFSRNYDGDGKLTAIDEPLTVKERDRVIRKGKREPRPQTIEMARDVETRKHRYNVQRLWDEAYFERQSPVSWPGSSIRNAWPTPEQARANYLEHGNLSGPSCYDRYHELYDEEWLMAEERHLKNPDRFGPPNPKRVRARARKRMPEGWEAPPV